MHSARAEAKNGRDPDEVIRRGAADGLVYKTRVQEREPAVTSPKMAPGEQTVWWEWVQRHVDYRLDALNEAVGAVIAQERQTSRAALKTEIDLLRRELAVLVL